MWLKNVSALLNDPRRRNIMLVTLLCFLTILFIGGVRLLTQLGGAKRFRGAAKIESMRSIRSIPGGSKKPPSSAYVALQMEQNKRLAEQAKKTGRSAIATIVDGFSVEESTVNPDNIHLQYPREPRLLSEAEQAMKEHKAFMSEQQTELTKQQVKGAMYQQMSQLFTTWSRSPAQTYESRPQENSFSSIPMSQHLTASNTVLVKAGTILHATLLTEINSDEPSPVLAEITTGEFKDARLIGQLSLVGERLLLQFHTLSVPTRSTTLTINALAIDAATAKTSLSGDVDRHTLLRYGSLGAAAFLNAYGTAYKLASEPNMYHLLLNQLDPRVHLLSAAGSIGTQFSSELAQQINKRPTVRIPAGTAIGVFCLSDLVETALKE